jgi:Flp pilus assembly pilin Flp
MPCACKGQIWRLIASERGVTSLEYALIASVIAGTVMSGATPFGNSLRNVFVAASTALNPAASVSSSGDPSSGGTPSAGGTSTSSNGSPDGNTQSDPNRDGDWYRYR